MPNLSIKDVPEALAEALRQRAARNHRSLQGELMALVEASVGQPAPGTIQEPKAVAYAAAAGLPPETAKSGGDLPAKLKAITSAHPRPDATSSSREARLKRLREIAADVAPGFRAADRLPREQAHDRAALRRMGI